MMKNKGFTLVELLVVISLIGILMGILLVAYQGTRKSSRDGRRKADLEQIRSALEICRTDKGGYPTSLPSGGGINCSDYLSSVPKDPLDPTYLYYYSGSDDTYTLCAYLEAGGVSSSCPGGCGSCGSGVICNYKICNP